MQLLILWRESFKSLSPANLMVLLRESVHVFVAMLTYFIKNYWWVFGLVSILVISYFFLPRSTSPSDIHAESVCWFFASVITYLLVIWQLLASAWLSLNDLREEKKIVYGWSFVFWLFCFVIFSIVFMFLSNACDGFLRSYPAYYSHFLSEYVTLGLLSLGALLFIFWSFFFLEPKCLLSLLQAIKMFLVTWPLVMVGFLVESVLLWGGYFVYGFLKNGVIAKSIFDIDDNIFIFLLLWLLNLILLISWLGVIYNRQLKEHNNYYFKS